MFYVLWKTDTNKKYTIHYIIIIIIIYVADKISQVKNSIALQITKVVKNQQ